MKDSQKDPSLREQGIALLTQGFQTTGKIDPAAPARFQQLLCQLIDQLEQVEHMLAAPSPLLGQRNPLVRLDQLPSGAKVACQGVAGAYSHIACNQVYTDPDIHFYDRFEQVTQAVASGQVDFGVLPIENSTAGDVEQIIEYICHHRCYIHTSVKVAAHHCLAAAPGASLESITTVYSHPQALRQSEKTLEKMGLTAVAVANTAVGAKRVADSANCTDACLCSALSAQLYGLKILLPGVQDQAHNTTRFVCIGSQAILLPQADTVSIALSFPNQPGALNSLLTQFSALGLDLSKIQSMPIGGTDFHVRFHLDFKGSVADPGVETLLGHMYESYGDFQFLGNFPTL